MSVETAPRSGSTEWVWSIVFPALAAFAVALCAAGRTFGLDGVLGGRLPRWAG